MRWLAWMWMTVALVGWSSARAQTPPAIAFKEVRLGAAVVSLPPDWPRHGADVPVWLHLHGAPAVVESGFAAIGAPGVLVNVTLPGLSRAYADHFSGDDVLPRLLGELEALLRREAPGQPWRVGRLTVSSFSAGFGGVRAMLGQAAAFERIGTLILADSIYCGYVGEGAQRRVNPDLMAGFVRFARAAADGHKRMLVTHSRQVPEGYASTTETADFLIQQLGGTRTLEAQDWPGGLRLQSQFSRGQLDIFGFEGDSADDHLRHLRALGVWFDRALPPGPAASATTEEELRAQLAAHVTHPKFRQALWSVKVVSLDTGRTLFEHYADRLMSPASNSKLYVGALALDRLGGDYRIVTPLWATKAPDAAGTIAGDLIVSGRGDPSWRSGPQRGELARLLDRFVEVVAAAGVRRVTGDLVADATYFRGPPNGAGWTVDDLNDYYGAEISALTLEDNTVELRVAPGAAVGDPCELTLLQPHSGVVLANHTRTIAAGSTRRIDVRRLPAEEVAHVFGELPLGGATLTVDVTVPRPEGWLATALKDALAQHGIEVAGRARGVRWPEVSPVSAGAVKLGEVVSPPLRELVNGFMKPSQNLETDLVFAHLGEAARLPETPAWRTSEQLALAQLREFLATHRLHAEDVRFDEGSGLSRNNLASANSVLALLQFMAGHREARAFADSLPVAGVDGTLRRRMKGTPAAGNVRAKTGTLRWAHSLSGYVTSAGGARLAFSVMLNRFVAAPGRTARDEVDAIAIMLARYAGGAPGSGAGTGGSGAR